MSAWDPRNPPDCLSPSVRNEHSCAHTLVAWLKATSAETGEPRLCEMCFRYRPTGSKRFCAVHRRSGMRRVPVAQERIAAAYQRQVLDTLTDDLEWALWLSLGIWRPWLIEESSDLWRNAPEILHRSARSIDLRLAQIRPLVGDRLHEELRAHLGSLVEVASVPFHTQRLGGDWAARGQAEDFLSWSSFIRTFYASEFFVPWVGQVSGRAKDPDHPAVSGGFVAVDMSVLDLVRLAIWQDLSLEDPPKRVLDDELVFLLRDFAGSSYRDLAKRFGVSPEAIRKALNRVGSAAKPTQLTRRHSPR
jgi:hypothetical protein